MRIEEDGYYICSECYENISFKGEPFKELLKVILESFTLLREPVAIACDRSSSPIIKYLENNNYILTTEFPDSETADDVVLAIPLGRQSQGNSFFFCFDTENHD
jgi:hypothetical protein